MPKMPHCDGGGAEIAGVQLIVKSRTKDRRLQISESKIKIPVKPSPTGTDGQHVFLADGLN